MTGSARRSILLRRLFATAALCLTACLDGSAVEPQLDPVADPLLSQIWTLILSDSTGAVWLVQSDTAFQARPEAPAAPVPASLWTRLDGNPAATGLGLRLWLAGDRLGWSVERDGRPWAAGAGSLGSSRAARVPVFRGGAAVPGLQPDAVFSGFAGTPLPARPAPLPSADPPHPIAARAVVTLRADDCPQVEPLTLDLLQSLRLRAEFAVPSRLVGQPANCSREFIQQALAAGARIEAHSRYHRGPPADFAEFYLETVGAAQDLRRLGADPRIFVQPGTWNSGPALFDSPAKLDTPYGALIRRVYSGIEAYDDSSSLIPLPDAGWTGPAPNVLSVLPPARVDSLIRSAAERGGWVEFMWHSASQPLDAIAPQLRVIAALRDSGLIAVLPFIEARAAVPGS